MSIVYSTLTSIFADAYECYANEVAIVSDEGDLTYAELGQRARRLAAGLRAAGVVPGDRVAILTKNRPEFFLIDHALAAGGLIRVGLNYRLHSSEVRHVAEDCEPKAVFLDRERAEESAKVLSTLDPPPLLVGLDRETPGVDLHYSELIAEAEIETVSVEPEQVAWLPYTSGTTGEPKGVMLSHRSLVACMRNLSIELSPIETNDLVLHVAPLSHMSGYVAMTYFARGAGQVVLPEFKAVDTLQAIDEHGATVLPLVPTMLNMLLPLLESEESGRWSMESLHTVLYAGSAIAPDRLARAIECLGPVFVQAYGLTEIPFPLSALSKRAHAFDPSRPPPPRLASGGRINPFVQVRLRKPDGTDAAPGEEGEIQARLRHDDAGVLEPTRRDRRGPDARRVAVDRRRRSDDRRLSAHRRSQEGHDRVGRLQHLPGRDRERHLGARRCGRGRGDRSSRRKLGRGGQSSHRCPRRRIR